MEPNQTGSFPLANEHYKRLTTRYNAEHRARLALTSPEAMEEKRQRYNAVRLLLAFMIGVSEADAVTISPDEVAAIPKALPVPKAPRAVRPSRPMPPPASRMAELHDKTPQVFIVKGQPKAKAAKPKAEEPITGGPKAGTPPGGLGGAAPPADQGGLVAKSRSPRGGTAMPAVALPMARPAQQGGASGSGGTHVAGPNRPAPSVGS